MPINFNNVDNIYHGTTRIKKVYKGSALEWEFPNYFRIVNDYAGANTITLTKTGSPTDITLKYSTDDGIHWTTWSSANGNLSVSLAQGEEMLFKGDNATFTTSSNDYFRFSGTQNHSVAGNIMYLLDSTGVSTTLPDYAFKSLFREDSKLINANSLILPALTLSQSCYEQFFYSCSSLQSLPALPAQNLATSCYESFAYRCSSITTVPSNYLSATTLASRCYAYMFELSGLTTAPNLPSITIADRCYMRMFSSTNITTAPVLPATVLLEHCYDRMFLNASSVNSVTIYANDISATDCLTSWLFGTAPNGIIHGLGSAALTVDSDSGQPVGWIACDTYPAYVKIRNSYSGNNTITITKNGSPADITLDYSTDKGNTWSTWSSANGNFSLTLSNGQSVYFKGDNSTFCSYDNYYTFNGTQSHTLGGNLVMLFDSTGTADSLPDGIFYKLFSGNTKLTYARNAIITATNFGDSSCHSMFLNCTAIGTAPNFTVNTIKTRGCSSMFDGATNLTYVNGIHLNATTLPNGAYKIMFRGTKIVDAPEIMATSIYAVSGDNSNGSLSYMFINCASLNTIKVHFTNWNSGNGTYYWTQGCKNTGTFYKPSALPSTKNASGNSSNPHYIPYNWTVSNI